MRATARGGRGDPGEEYRDYVSRLEEERMAAVAAQREKAARALERVARADGDEELAVEARAERAAADEYRRALKRYRASRGNGLEGRSSGGSR
jgi:hypothetical protein